MGVRLPSCLSACLSIDLSIYLSIYRPSLESSPSFWLSPVLRGGPVLYCTGRYSPTSSRPRSFSVLHARSRIHADFTRPARLPNLCNIRKPSHGSRHGHSVDRKPRLGTSHLPSRFAALAVNFLDCYESICRAPLALTETGTNERAQLYLLLRSAPLGVLMCTNFTDPVGVCMAC